MITGTPNIDVIRNCQEELIRGSQREKYEEIIKRGCGKSINNADYRNYKT